MSGYRIFWGIFLGLLTGGFFLKSWNLEHDQKENEDSTDEEDIDEFSADEDTVIEGRIDEGSMGEGRIGEGRRYEGRMYEDRIDEDGMYENHATEERIDVDFNSGADECETGSAYPIVKEPLLAEQNTDAQAASENDKPGIFSKISNRINNTKNTKTTEVWSSPVALIILIVIFSGFLYFRERNNDGMLDVFTMLVSVMILFTCYFLVMIVVLPFMRKIATARACAVMWIAPIFLFLYYYGVDAWQHVPLYQLYVPKKAMLLALMIWFAGFALILAGRLLSDSIYIHQIVKTSAAIEEGRSPQILQNVMDQLEYNVKISLLESSKASGPFATGGCLRKTRIILPKKNYSDEELQMIFSHEIHHLQRGDVDTKLFLVFITSLCWFNPFVWIAARKAVEDLELSCDEIVAESMDDSERKKYALLLLNNTASSRGLTTCLSAAAGVLRYRMKRIVDIEKDRRNLKKKHWIGTVCIGFSVFLCTITYGMLGITDQQGTFGEIFLSDNGINTNADAMDANDAAVSDTNGVFKNVCWSDSVQWMPIYIWNTDQLEEQVSRISLQKIRQYGTFESTADSPSLYFNMATDDGYLYFNLYDDFLKVENFETDRNYYYKVISDIDWDAIKATLDFNAVAQIDEDDSYIDLDSPELNLIFQEKDDNPDAISAEVEVPANLIGLTIKDTENGEFLEEYTTDEPYAADNPYDYIQQITTDSEYMTLNFSCAQDTVTVYYYTDQENKEDIKEKTLDATSGSCTMKLNPDETFYIITAVYINDGIEYTQTYKFLVD